MVVGKGGSQLYFRLTTTGHALLLLRRGCLDQRQQQQQRHDFIIISIIILFCILLGRGFAFLRGRGEEMNCLIGDFIHLQ